jgi:hypothetical protein
MQICGFKRPTIARWNILEFHEVKYSSRVGCKTVKPEALKG